MSEDIFDIDDANVEKFEECIAEETKAMEVAYSEMVRDLEIREGGNADTSGLLGHFIITNLATLSVMICKAMDLPCTHYGTVLPAGEGQEELVSHLLGKDEENSH